MIANHKGEIPAVILLLPFLLGISLGIGLIASSHITVLWAIFAVSVGAFIILNKTYQRFAVYKHRWIGGILVHVILFVSGCIAAINYNELNNKDHFSKSTAQYLLIKINNEPQLKNGLVRFTASTLRYSKQWHHTGYHKRQCRHGPSIR